MKLALSVRLLRLFLYVLILLGLPICLVVGWKVVVEIVPDVRPEHYIGAAQVFMSFVIVGMLIERFKRRVQTVGEYELRASREQFLALYEHSPVPYVSLDQAGHVIMYNLAAVRLLRTTTEALMGTSLVDRFTLEDVNELSVILGKIKANYAVQDAEVQVQTLEGDTKWVLLSVYVYGAGEERLVSMVDITHQKIVEQAKSDFVALATHQLRTPIAAIRWNLELLDRSLLRSRTQEQGKYLDTLGRNVLKMIALINDFLSVSKLEAGTFATKMESIDIVPFFDGIIDEFAGLITEKQIQFERDYEPRGLVYTTDSRLLHIAVSNLLSNAVKYVKVGGTVTFRYELLNAQLVIVVSDNGIGIPAAEQSQLFSKFFRATNAQVFRAEGTGLGLYIVKESVEKLGGTIEVVSREDVGSIFTIKLPYA